VPVAGGVVSVAVEVAAVPVEISVEVVHIIAVSALAAESDAIDPIELRSRNVMHVERATNNNEDVETELLMYFKSFIYFVLIQDPRVMYTSMPRIAGYFSYPVYKMTCPFNGMKYF
jgi:hypothetical protein